MDSRMLKDTARAYSSFFTPDLIEKLKPINHALDNMLARLEEFETMISLLHEEETNTYSLKGSLMDVMQEKNELKNLFDRIDALEKIVDHAKAAVNYSEMKIEAAEKNLSLMQTSSKIKDFLKPLWRISTDAVSSGECDKVNFNVEDYFPDSVLDDYDDNEVTTL